jgi:NADH-quinone oxidoreductase subunit E
MDQEKLAAILSRHQSEPGDLIAILHDIQAAYGFLPQEELQEVARRLQIPLTRVFSVATFYKGFTLAPMKERARRPGDPQTQYYSLARFYPGFGESPIGEHHLRVCQGTACHLHGGDRLLESVSRRLGIEAGQTSADLQFSLEKVKCLGNCDKAPMLMVDDDFYNRVGIDRLTKILKPYRKPK